MTEKHRTGQVPLTVRVFDDPRIAAERITAGTMDRPGPPGAFKLPPRFPQRNRFAWRLYMGAPGAWRPKTAGFGPGGQWAARWRRSARSAG
jgi:hypothetical protein